MCPTFVYALTLIGSRHHVKLAISLSTFKGCIAIGDGKNDCLAHRFNRSQEHSALFFQALEGLLARANIGRGAIRSVVVDIGPGSFIGVRSAIVIAQALARAHRIPVQPLQSLEILANQVPPWEHQWLLTAQDARMKQCYYALWRRQGGEIKLYTPAALADPGRIQDIIKERDCRCIGTAFDPECRLSERTMLALAEKKSQWTTPEALKPLYIRNTVTTN